MPPGSRKVAITGVALADCGRVDGTTPYALHAQAARRALAGFFNDTATTEIYTSLFVGSVRCV